MPEPPGPASGLLTVWLLQEQVRGPAEAPQAPDDREATQVCVGGGGAGLRSRDRQEEGERWRTPEPSRHAPEAGRTSVAAVVGNQGRGLEKPFGVRLGRARASGSKLSHLMCSHSTGKALLCRERWGRWERKGFGIKEQVSSGQVERFFKNVLMTQDI